MQPNALTVYLVSCVSKKREQPCAARDLFVSDWFRKVRRFVEASECPWYILSAKHGLVSPDQVIAPYEQTLSKTRAAERLAWGEQVAAQLASVVLDHPFRVVFLAGERYREFLVPHLASRGVEVSVPMEGRRIGEQLRWLGQHHGSCRSSYHGGTLMTFSASAASKLDQLEARLGANWTVIRAAREATRQKRQDLAENFATYDSPDTSLVVFGSVAREEVTSGSDLDWILLIDGQSVPEHKEQEREIARLLIEKKFVPPGRSGIFGGMVGSHDLVHHICGEDDLNSNTTRRVLLLLESYPVGNREAYDRVRRQIIRRYLGDDRGLTHAGGDVRIPRFLLNDLTRYWRTIAVDFVYKQRAEDDKKWAIRNAKLRLSRKLIFAAGLANVFFCHLDPVAEEARIELRKGRTVSRLTAYLVEHFAHTPLEIIAKACVDLGIHDATARDIFDSYDRFLGILDDPDQRADLERAQTHDDLRSSPTWAKIRDVSKPFHDGLVNLFLRDNEQLKDLTMKYGVF